MCCALLNINPSGYLEHNIAQLAGAVEYTDCFSAEGVRTPSPNKCPGYDTKQSDGKVPVMLELWRMQSTPSLPLLQVHSGPEWLYLIWPYLWVK